ncbi:MAG: ATP-binding protein [Salinivirgaceae bacterium]
MIYRKISKTLIETLEYFPVLGLVGPRQVGKTTLAKYLQSSLNKESVYIDIENPKDISKLNDPVLFFERNQEKCVILDEIQRMPELFPVLRSMIDENRIPARFIILGSASPDLIRDSSESLAGRIAYEELTPFNLTEVKTNETYAHWLSGGFPSAFLAPNDKLRIKWFTNFIKTYIERDLPMLGLNINHNILRKFWTMIAHIHGNVLNMQTLGKSLEISSTTIKKYLAFLENAFLIRQLYPFYANVKKRMVKSPKIYIRDAGILHHLLDIPNFDALESNPIIGSSWEGYVIEQITQLADEDTQFFFYRTHEGAECDLVQVKGGKVLSAIEIKYTSSPKISKGMRNAFDDIKAIDNYIITPNTDNYFIEKDIQVINLQQFLEENY